jgi:hypothetical protein
MDSVIESKQLELRIKIKSGFVNVYVLPDNSYKSYLPNKYVNQESQFLNYGDEAFIAMENLMLKKADLTRVMIAINASSLKNETVFELELKTNDHIGNFYIETKSFFFPFIFNFGKVLKKNRKEGSQNFLLHPFGAAFLFLFHHNY